MKIWMTALLIGLCLASCSQGMYDDNLSSVPVTNNPNLFPRTSQTATGPGLGN